MDAGGRLLLPPGPVVEPRRRDQAVDRTSRIGQTQKVMVYRMVAQGTIEEKVMELKTRKADLFSRGARRRPRVLREPRRAGHPLARGALRAAPPAPHSRELALQAERGSGADSPAPVIRGTGPLVPVAAAAR
ncbi:hypothetical protein QJS66_08975 [Kocuria rhizophila]|nr:hypothetical protein QJS66_08975 [Kocuria rhizophila]